MIEPAVALPAIEMLDAKSAEVLRALPAHARMAIAFSCNRTFRLRIAAQLERLHSDWTPEQISAEVARRMLRGTD